MSQKSNSVWWWVGGGCLGLVILMAVTTAGVVFFGMQQVKSLEAQFKNPDLRDARAAELLGLEELPEGYEANIAIAVSSFVKTVILSERALDSQGDEPEVSQGGEYDESEPLVVEPAEDQQHRDSKGRVLFYLQTPGKQKDPVVGYFRGETDDPRVLSKQGINIDLEDSVARGEVDAAGSSVLWVTHYGELELDIEDFEDLSGSVEFRSGSDSSDRRGKRRRRRLANHGEGTTTLLLPMCDDRKARLGVWTGPHELSPEAAEAEQLTAEDLSGSTGDEAQIAAFVADMDFCS